MTVRLPKAATACVEGARMELLISRGPIYFAQLDEDAFFEWLDKVKCVRRYWGDGAGLHIEIQEKTLNQQSVSDLLALFKRYGLDMRPLAALERAKFSAWFRDPLKYWHREVFGSPTRRSRPTKE